MLSVVHPLKLAPRSQPAVLEAIKAVRAGEEVVLAGRGQPIAVIKPVKEKDALGVALQAMVDEGLLETCIPKGPIADTALAAK